MVFLRRKVLGSGTAKPVVGLFGLIGLAALGLVLVFFAYSGTRAASAAVGDSIPFRGIEAEGEGAAAWNADGSGPEPANTGHLTPWTNCLEVAYYHLASRDYSNIDFAAVAGLHGLSPFVPAESFPLLAAALADNGLNAGDLRMSWGLQTLGADLEGQDWMYDDVAHVETRYYTGGDFTLKLEVVDGQPLEDVVGGLMPTTTLTIDYNVLDFPGIVNCLDDEISGATGVGMPEDRSVGSSLITQAVSAALLNDLAGNGIRFIFDSLQAAGQEEFTGNGRRGAFFEAQTGRIEVAVPDVLPPLPPEDCSCPIGIFEADNTHDWQLQWTTAGLPDADPVRLKVVASSVSPAESGSIIVNITDDIGPKSIEVIHLATGDTVDYLELDITPGVMYQLTVEHTGDAHHYALGASHDDLALMQADVRFLEALTQEWGITAGAGETVTLQVTTESANLDANQATAVELTVVDPATGAVVHGPDNRALVLDTPEAFTFANGPTARELVVTLDRLDGHVNMIKIGGDTYFSVLPCPQQDAPEPQPVPSLSVWGIVVMTAASAAVFAWSRRRRMAISIPGATGK